MQVTILQLNMWAGTLFSALKDFLQTNSFDIFCFQEVAGPGAKHGNVDCKVDCFAELQNVLATTHKGILAISQVCTANPKTGYFGNAIFFNKDFNLTYQYTLPLFERTTPFSSDATSFEELGRNVLHLTLQQENTVFDIVTTHLALAKDPKRKIEGPHQREQNIKLINYVKELKNPFILTGDFNIEINQPTVIDLGKIATNLTQEYGVINTVDSVVHKAWEQIKPGFSIDYIFASPLISVVDFEALEYVHISDHFGLKAIVEI